MRIINSLTNDEKNTSIQRFYESFKDGFDFEAFLKPFLEAIGLTEVFVTKKTGDDGIDLTAKKSGIIELNQNDSVNYKIQAKRTDPTKTISPEKIDALRGNLATNEKGLFITTSKVSKSAKEKGLTKDPNRPVIVIDGSDLIDICIDKQIGFAYTPVFSRSALVEFMDKEDKLVVEQDVAGSNDNLEFVNKLVTNNDIKRHIISIPSAIVEKMTNNNKNHVVKVLFNNEEFSFTYTPSRKMFSSVTAALDKFGFRKEDGSYESKIISWAIDSNNLIIMKSK